MRKLSAFVPALFLLVGCAFVWNARSQAATPLAAPLKSIFPTMAGYRVVDQTIPNDERQVAGMSDYVARVYWRDSVAAFTTFVSYYERQTQGKTIHSPRNCLPGAGWEVLTAGMDTLVVGGTRRAVNKFVLKNQGATAIAFYWYQGRGRIVANEYAVKWNLLRDAAIAGHTEEALVRVVVPVIAPTKSSDDAESRRALAVAGALGADISARLMADVDRVLPKA